MALDAESSLLQLKLQGTGNNENTWGDLLNEQTIVPIENAIAGYVEIAVDGGTNALTAAQRRCAMIEFTGVLASNQTITVDNLSKEWLVKNSTSGNYTLMFKTSAGTAAEIRQGGWCCVWCDGDDNIHVGPSSANFAAQMYGPDGSDSLPGYSFASDLDTGMRRKGANNACLVANGVDVLEWLSSGVNIAGVLAVSSAITQGGQRIVPVGNMQPTARILAPSGWMFCYGQAISRTIYSELFDAITITATATRNGTTGLSSVSVDLTGLGLEGAAIEGTGISSGTTISSLTSNSITLSSSASGSGSMTIRIVPYGVGDGSTTFNVPDKRGRGSVARDNMGGASADRLTGLPGGINGDRLAATGGSERHTLSLGEIPQIDLDNYMNDPGHVHGEEGFQPQHQTQGGTGSYAGFEESKATGSSQTGITWTPFGGGNPHNNVQPGQVDNWIIFTGVFS